MKEAHNTHQDVINGLRKALQVAHAEAEVRPLFKTNYLYYIVVYIYIVYEEKDMSNMVNVR